MVHMLLVYEKKDITDLHFSFGISPVYTSGFLLQQLNPIFVLLELQVKNRTYKTAHDFNLISLRFAAKSLRSRNLLKI